ncbi:GNAT family N-acetyltransferase [Streptomyces sp. NBC_01341]|uniref:GNAT family N-acetyltransferase n=1 Tax=Streptomyces sp. NBC_01341 TaxID=2903831 RepID=UPI002E11C440|nr:GNAT family N-acetyltransferase [Streptomyces sp. NBC_01341]
MTTRLALYPLSAAEAADIEASGPGGPSAAHWAPGYPDDGDRRAAGRLLRTCASVGDPGPFGAFEIRRRTDGLAIGGAGFHGAPDSEGRLTVGYGLIASARGFGYAAEALGALLSFARSRGVLSVKGDADLDNVASHRVMTSAGMRLVAVDDRLRHYRVDWRDTPAQDPGECAADAGPAVGRRP